MKKSSRILVVDDSEPHRELVAVSLRVLGHEVVLAGDGLQALGMLNSTVDLVLLDVVMPGMDGFQVAREVRNRSDCGDIPIIMITSLTAKEDRLRALQAGANDFIAKPVDRFELEVRVASILKMKESTDALKDYQAKLEDIIRSRTAELRLSEERFRTLAQVAPFGIVVLSKDEKTEYINPKFREIFGYGMADVPDMASWFSKSHPDKRHWERAMALWREETSEVTVIDGLSAEAAPKVTPLICKDGSKKIINFRPVVLADGRLVVTFLDVTAEALAQEKIRRAKEEWERTFHAVSDMIVLLDKDRRVVRMNTALARRLGVDPDQAIGRNCRDHASNLIGLESICPDANLLSEDREFSTEVFDPDLGGIFDVRVSPLREGNGRLFGTVHVARDITLFKSMERARKLAVNHLAHELTTPLSIIRASVRQLLDEDLNEETRRERVRRINRNLERLAGIQHVVREIVDQPDYRPISFPLESALDEIVREIRSGTEHREVGIVVSTRVDETEIVDPHVFSIAVNTLVKNAVENTPDEGRVSISVHREDAGILLRVEDSGVGIPLEDQGFVFEAFHHTQPTERYSTKQPFDFNAGGKGLELLRLKMFSDSGFLRVSFSSRRCRHIPTRDQFCPGRVSLCENISTWQECLRAGGTIFSVLFSGQR